MGMEYQGGYPSASESLERELLGRELKKAKSSGSAKFGSGGDYELEGPARMSSRSGAQSAQNSELDNLLNTLLANLLPGDYFGAQKRSELAKQLSGLTQPGLAMHAGGGGGNNRSVGGGRMEKAPMQGDGFNAFRENQRANFSRGQRSKDMELARRDEMLKAQQKMSLIRQFLGASGGGGGTTTTTTNGVQDQMFSNQYRHETVPLRSSQTTTTSRNPYELLQYFLA